MKPYQLPLTRAQINHFQNELLIWFDEHGRHDLPWQQNKSPYRVWISEIMLQQTQVTTVIPYYEKFMASFPTLIDLAQASQDEVLSHWSGLGYYARARNMHKAAQLTVTDFAGDLPDNLDEMMSLPGIGRSTAGAILAISSNQNTPIQDGNVRRVLSRLFAIEGDLSKAEKQKQLWEIATDLTPIERVADYTQAIMDLGATLCTRTKVGCDRCPFTTSCQAYLQNKVVELPNKKAKKQIPVKQEYFLFWFDGEELLMQQRPQSGIWGGLWCPPAFETKDELTNYLRQLNAVEPELDIASEPYRHVFSHYKLDIVPVYVKSSKPNIISESNHQWLTITDWLKAGLPTPIKQLLQGMT